MLPGSLFTTLSWRLQLLSSFALGFSQFAIRLKFDGTEGVSGVIELDLPSSKHCSTRKLTPFPRHKGRFLAVKKRELQGHHRLFYPLRQALSARCCQLGIPGSLGCDSLSLQRRKACYFGHWGYSLAGKRRPKIWGRSLG